MLFKILSHFLLLYLFTPQVLGHPEQRIVFQPQFLWADKTCTQQGTGCFIQGINGSVIGLTSAHFINFSGPQLLEVQWLDIKTGKFFTRSIKSFGLPGHEGSYDPLDLKSDYFLFLLEEKPKSETILECDRSMPEIQERIWFPDKNKTTDLGYELVEGTVSKACEEFLLVILDQDINLQSRSGTPILSQRTGKVIGILVGGDKRNRRLLYITPAASIFKALLNAQDCFLLRDVVGESSTH